ncbi:MAG: hypothetical protein FWG70_05695 [Oscillospiraceae bacterium]|nr:hypothetical protein [Oscillospiraceae bacterium]
MASDLLSFCHLYGATDYHLDIKRIDSANVFEVKASPVTISDESLEKLRKYLSAPRQREMEQDFWELMGNSEEYSEMMLIGMMCDHAEAQIEGDELTIVLKREI